MTDGLGWKGVENHFWPPREARVSSSEDRSSLRWFMNWLWGISAGVWVWVMGLWLVKTQYLPSFGGLLMQNRVKPPNLAMPELPRALWAWEILVFLTLITIPLLLQSLTLCFRYDAKDSSFLLLPCSLKMAFLQCPCAGNSFFYQSGFPSLLNFLNKCETAGHVFWNTCYIPPSLNP